MSDENNIPEIPVDAQHFDLGNAPEYVERSRRVIRAIQMPRPFLVRTRFHGLLHGAPDDYLIQNNDDPQDKQRIEKDIFEAAYDRVVQGAELKSDVAVEDLAKELHEAGRAAVEAGLVVNKVPGQPFLEWDEITDAARIGRRVQAGYLLSVFHILKQ